MCLGYNCLVLLITVVTFFYLNFKTGTVRNQNFIYSLLGQPLFSRNPSNQFVIDKFYPNAKDDSLEVEFRI